MSSLDLHNYQNWHKVNRLELTFKVGASIKEVASVSSTLSSAEVLRRMTVPRSSFESIIFATSSNCKL